MWPRRDSGTFLDDPTWWEADQGPIRQPRPSGRILYYANNKGRYRRHWQYFRRDPFRSLTNAVYAAGSLFRDNKAWSSLAFAHYAAWCLIGGGLGAVIPLAIATPFAASMAAAGAAKVLQSVDRRRSPEIYPPNDWRRSLLESPPRTPTDSRGPEFERSSDTREVSTPLVATVIGPDGQAEQITLDPTSGRVTSLGRSPEGRPRDFGLIS